MLSQMSRRRYNISTSRAIAICRPTTPSNLSPSVKRTRSKQRWLKLARMASVRPQPRHLGPHKHLPRCKNCHSTHSRYDCSSNSGLRHLAPPPTVARLSTHRPTCSTDFAARRVTSDSTDKKLKSPGTSQNFSSLLISRKNQVSRDKTTTPLKIFSKSSGTFRKHSSSTISHTNKISLDSHSLFKNLISLPGPPGTTCQQGPCKN
jgi:hypothetical protein